MLKGIRDLAIFLYVAGAALGLARLLSYWAGLSTCGGDSGPNATWALVPPGPVCDYECYRDYDGITTVWLVALVTVPFAIRWFTRQVATISAWTVAADD